MMLSNVHLIRFVLLFSVVVMLSCSDSTETKEEQLSVSSTASEEGDNDTTNSIKGNILLKDLMNEPNKVILTGLKQHRLITVYKKMKKGPKKARDDYYSYGSYEEVDRNGAYSLFMPGIDLISGYNLINVAHYDLTQEKLNYLFEHPVLVKSLYYPSYEQDSLNEKPINRNYFMVSVYDADTNADTLINRFDLRRFYYFNDSCTGKAQLIPPDYSVERSQYDPKNDVMYIFARHDANKNGTASDDEPLHVFWINLEKPENAKRLY